MSQDYCGNIWRCFYDSKCSKPESKNKEYREIESEALRRIVLEFSAVC